jgi:peptide/nickel transport system substrate-binding protein
MSDTPTCVTRTNFASGLPYIDKIEAVVDEDNASRMAAFLGSKYDLGWENPGTIARVEWVQIKDVLKQRRPGLRTLESPSNVMSHIYMRTDKAPFNDVRVRRAMSLAINRQTYIDVAFEGVGTPNPPVPAALKDWAIPFEPARRGRAVVQARSRRRQEAPGRGRAGPTGSRPRSTSPPTARPCWSIRCSSS